MGQFSAGKRSQKAIFLIAHWAGLCGGAIGWPKHWDIKVQSVCGLVERLCHQGSTEHSCKTDGKPCRLHLRPDV